MLSNPKHGWVELKVSENVYHLSYIYDFIVEWLKLCKQGLDNNETTVLEAYDEPGRIIVVLSKYNVYVIKEAEDDLPCEKDGVAFEYSDMTMVQFCQNLYKDVLDNIDSWVKFKYSMEFISKEQLEELREKLKNEILQNLTWLKNAIDRYNKYHNCQEVI